MTDPLKISFCTSCKGRLEHLKQTLPANLKAAEDYPNAEFVVLDYGDEPALGEWIKENYQDEMDNGRVRYVSYPSAENFKMAHAKNMAHRMATGDVLCNLDADNFIGEGFCEFLNDEFSKDANIIVQPRYRDNGFSPSLAGRIAISSDNFRSIRGYNESMTGWGGDDNLFVKYAHQSGLKAVFANDANIAGRALEHPDEQRIENLSEDDKEFSQNLLEGNADAKEAVWAKIDKLAESVNNNNGKVGCGEVFLNFHEQPIQISKLKVQPQKLWVDAVANNDPNIDDHQGNSGLSR